MRKKARGNYNVLGTYSWFVPGAAGLMILLLWFIVGALLGNAATVVFTLVAGTEAAMDYAMLVSYPLMFLPPMIYAAFKSRRASLSCGGLRLDSANFGKTGGLRCALMVMLATFAAGFCTDLLNSAMPPMPEWLETALKSMTQGDLWVNALCVSVFAPFFEEWLCRGMVLRGLLGNKVRPVWAIVISALFFALIHMNPWQAIPAFILGCLFGYVYYKTGSLKLTMLMHFTNNTVALVCGNIESLKDMDYWTDVLPGSVYAIIFVAGLIVLSLTVMAFSRIPAGDSGCGCDKVPPVFGE